MNVPEASETMKQSIVNYLACLRCASDLTVQEVTRWDDKEIINGSLECSACRESYPVINGVPRFTAYAKEADDKHTGAKFTESWTEFSRMDVNYWQQFFDWIGPVNPDFIKDKVVLEGGCGKGRHSEVVARAGARAIVSVDIGDSVDVAFKNAGHLPQVHIIQADISNLPLKPCFDYAFSVGVLHHMTKPFNGFKSLVSKLNSKGAISAWVYGRENNGWIVHLLNPIRIHITSRLPKFAVKSISWLLTVTLYVYCKAVIAPWVSMKRSVSFLPDLYYQEYLFYISKFDFTEMFNIVFDHLIAPVAYYLSEGEVRHWFLSTGFREPRLRWHNKNSWSAFCAKTEAETEKVFAATNSSEPNRARV